MRMPAMRLAADPLPPEAGRILNQDEMVRYRPPQKNRSEEKMIVPVGTFSASSAVMYSWMPMTELTVGWPSRADLKVSDSF